MSFLVLSSFIFFKRVYSAWLYVVWSLQLPVKMWLSVAHACTAPGYCYSGMTLTALGTCASVNTPSIDAHSVSFTLAL